MMNYPGGTGKGEKNMIKAKETITALVKAVQGKEFLYQPSSAHGVSHASAQKICDALNRVRYNLQAGQIWRVMTFDKYDSAYNIALRYQFTTRAGAIRESRYWIAR